MPRYIDADKVIEIIKNYGKDAVSEGRMTLDAVDDIVCLAQAIDYIPTADVAEVKHGEWVYSEFDMPHCSECGTEVMPCNISSYCPHCGAKMGDANHA